MPRCHPQSPTWTTLQPFLREETEPFLRFLPPKETHRYQLSNEGWRISFDQLYDPDLSLGIVGLIIYPIRSSSFPFHPSSSIIVFSNPLFHSPDGTQPDSPANRFQTPGTDHFDQLSNPRLPPIPPLSVPKYQMISITYDRFIKAVPTPLPNPLKIKVPVDRAHALGYLRRPLPFPFPRPAPDRL